MLDVDLRRNDQHTFVPIRAAWIDHGTRRVVVDARALEDATGAAVGTGAAVAAPGTVTPGALETTAAVEPPVALPALARGGPLTDADIQRFDADYVRAYGERGTDRDATWRVARGSDEALRFEPRRLLDPAAPVAPAPEAPVGATSASPATVAPPAASPPAAPVLDESRGVNAIMDAPADAQTTGYPTDERRGSRVDDASALDDDAAIDPRELDARVRIEEGATVDEGAPVAGVRYDADPHPQHDYGTPNDAYGPGHGSGRIGFNRVVSREPYAPADAPAGAPNSVRYRRYEDGYAGPPR